MQSEKTFDKHLIYKVSDQTADGIRNNIQRFHRSSEAHLFLKNLGDECINQDDLKKVGKSDSGKGRNETKTQHGKYTDMQNLVDPTEHKPIFVVFFSGPEKHISKKCPVNGQNLTKYV